MVPAPRHDAYGVCCLLCWCSHSLSLCCPHCCSHCCPSSHRHGLRRCWNTGVFSHRRAQNLYSHAPLASPVATCDPGALHSSSAMGSPQNASLQVAWVFPCSPSSSVSGILWGAVICKVAICNRYRSAPVQVSLKVMILVRFVHI